MNDIMTCLNIINFQKGMITPDTVDIVPKIDNIVTALPKRFDLIVASQFRNLELSPYEKLLDYTGMREGDELNIASEIVDKGQEIYAVYNKTSNTCFTYSFANLMQDYDIKKMYICGLNTNLSVLGCAFDCFDENMDFSVIIDCCATTQGHEMQKAAERLLYGTFGPRHICTSDDILKGNM